MRCAKIATCGSEAASSSWSHVWCVAVAPGGGSAGGAGWGVRSRVQWTTRRRTRSRRMINNENTAKQTAARGRRGRGAAVRAATPLASVAWPALSRRIWKSMYDPLIRNRHRTLVKHRHFDRVSMTYVTAGPMRHRRFWLRMHSFCLVAGM